MSIEEKELGCSEDGVMRPACGFVGLGSQGAPIARRILEAGYPLTLWARHAQTLDAFRNTPASFARDLVDLAQRCAHVGICVTDDDAVKDVCDPILANMAPGGYIAIHSTVHPNTCRALAERATRSGLVVIDAPVSGGAPAAQAGALTLMVGGAAEALAAARPIFQTFARLIVHLGDVGTGQMAKIINNSLMAANLALVHHALQAAVQLGLDPAALSEILKASSGRSFALEVYTRWSATGEFTHGATLVDKVRLLGDLLGERDPAYRMVRDVAVPVLDRLGAKATDPRPV